MRRSLSAGPAGESSTSRRRGRGPRRRRRWARCGGNGTAGATGRCSRSGSTAPRRGGTARSESGAALPYLVLFQIALPLLAPLIDLFSIYGLLFIGARWVGAYWATFLALQLALGWYAFRLDRESPWPLVAMPFQPLVYRQLMYLVVVESVLSALRGTRQPWRPSDRTGEVEVAR
jgi:hypothetical protein